MALQRFSVNQWLNDNGYDSPTADANGSKAQTNKTLDIDRSGADLERFSVDSWFRDNGLENPTFEPFKSSIGRYPEPTLAPMETVEEENKNSWLGGIVGSLGAGVVNLLSTAISTQQTAMKASWETLKSFADEDGTGVLSKEYWDKNKQQYEALKTQALQPEFASVNKKLKPIENAIREWADIENEGWFTKAVAGATESAPALVASAAVPVLGTMLMFNQSYKNTLENDVIIANQKAQLSGTEPDYKNLMTKAVAAGAIEVATEKLFNLFAGMKGSYKAMSEGATGIAPKAVAVIKGFYKGFTDTVAEPTIKNFALHIVKKANEEGIEEIASTFLNGLVALATTDKDKPLFSTKAGDNGIITWEELRGSYVGGAVMGGVMAGVSGVSQNSKTRKYLESIQNTNVSDVTVEQQMDLNDALDQDRDSPFFEDEVKGNLIQSATIMQQGVISNTLRTEPIEYETLEPQPIAESSPAITGDKPAIEPTVAQPVVDMSKKEVISTKSSTGEVFKIGNKVYKSATFRDGTTRTLEAKAYDMLQDVDGVAKGKLTVIDGKEYIETPFYKHIISTDDIARENRDKYSQIILNDIDSILKTISQVTDRKIRYNDPLQFGYEDGKLYLLDFSNSEMETGSVYDGNALDDNFNALSNFLESFGITRLSKIISKSKYFKGYLDLYTLEDIKNHIALIPKNEIPIIEKLKESGGDIAPNNMYYATNARDIWLGGIAQTDSIDGVKYIYSETPISPSKLDEWEISVIYEKNESNTSDKTETKTEPKAQPAESWDSIVNDRNSNDTDEARIDKWVDSEEGRKKLSHIKTELDIVNEISRIKNTIMENKIGSNGMLKVNLQLLALKSWAVRLELNKKKGSRIHGIISNLIPRLMDGKAEGDKLVIANLLDTEQILYEVMKMDTVKEQAVGSMETMRKDGNLDTDIREKLEKAKQGEYQLTPQDVYIIGTRIKELIDNVGDDISAQQDQLLGAEYMDMLSKEQTKMGQSTVIMRALYNTLWPHMANSFEKKLRKATNMEKYNDERVNKTSQDAEKANKDALVDAVKEVEKEIHKTREAKPKKPTTETTPKEKTPKTPKEAAEILANRIKLSVEKKPGKVATELMREVNELFKRYKQTVPQKRTEGMSVFDFLAEVATNRDTYQADVKKAVDILKQKYDNHPLLDEFYEQIANTPDEILSDATLYKTIAKQMKDNDVSLTEVVKAFNMVSGSGEAFIESIRAKMPTLSDVEWNFLKDKLSDAFARKMNDKIMILRETYRRNASIVPSVKSAQELTIKALQDATFYDALNIDRIRDQWAKRMKLPYINHEMRVDIYDTMRKIAKMQSEQTVDADAIDREYTALTERLAQHIPANLRDKIASVRRFGMLGNLRTHIKNGATNIVTGQVYNLSDSIANFLNKSKALHVGQDYQIRGDKMYRFGSNTAIDTAITEEMNPQRMQKKMIESSQYSVGSLMGVEKQIFETKWLNDLMNTPYRLQQGQLKLGKLQNAMLWMTDSFMFQKHYKTQLANKLNALGFNEHMTIEQKQKALDTATEYASKISIQRTFRELNAFSKAVKSLRNGDYMKRTIQQLEKQADIESDPLKKFAMLQRAHDIKKATDGAGMIVDFIVPFIATPAALVKEGVKFSPAGAMISIARIVDAKYRTKSFEGETAAKLNQDFAQSIAGTGTMFVLGVALSMLGVLNLEPPENEKDSEAWAEQGKGKYSLYLPGLGSLSLDWLQPLVGSMIAGGASWKALQGSANFGEVLVDLMKGNVDSIFSNTIISNITRQFGGYNKTTTDLAANVIQSGLLQMLPTVLQQLNKSFDPYVRDAYSGDALDIMKNRMLITIPFASTAVAPKYDVWGKPIEQVAYKGVAGFATRFILNTLSPFTYTKARTDSTTAEVIKVFEATKADKNIGSNALPIAVSDKFTLNSKTYALNETQYAEYSQLAGQYQKQAVEKIVTSSTYASKTDAVKAKAFRIAYMDAVEKARKEIAKKYPTVGVSNKS